MTHRRLIEAAFPLKQVSLDSVHEKNVRHGHISTLHIWPARRPLAASRAALLATLLPDPGTREEQREVLRRMAGTTVKTPDAKGERMREETRGGVLHWGREGVQDWGGAAGGVGRGAGTGRTSGVGRAAADGASGGVQAKGGSGVGIEAFREQIRQAFGGRAPRVLDPFAGGGAIPLEAMRLGCEAVASDLNPVAWFILRCTLHYPHLLAGQRRPLPAFALRDRAFVAAFLKGQGVKAQKALAPASADLLDAPVSVEADFAWHLRAWGQRVLDRARRALAVRYPTYAEFEPLRPKGRGRQQVQLAKRYRPRPPQLLTPDAEGRVSTAALNAEFDALYLEDAANPRWVAKPTVAYLWARTVRCAGCRREVPLLKTCWLCKKGAKRVLLRMTPGEGGVAFGIEEDVPVGAAQGRQSDQQLGAGTMSGSGATCPCCGVTAAMSDLRAAGRAGQLGERLTAVVVYGQQGKEYRLPTEAEIEAASLSEEALAELYAEIPFGLPQEPTPKAGVGASRAFSVDGYGFDTWRKLFTNRQLLALGTFIREMRSLWVEEDSAALAGNISGLEDYPKEWREALVACLAPAISRSADRGSSVTTWTNDREGIGHTFARFALPMVWDFAESCPLGAATGSFRQAIEWIARVVEHLQDAAKGAPSPQVLRQSAAEALPGAFDLICTDPPYYDAIPYSDLMDFFHIWLRRALHGLSPETDAVFAEPLGPKWDAAANDGELIDDAARFGGDRAASKRNYEDGMARSFARFHAALREDGRLVLVFANKQPDAWETLVSALIRAGFVVVGSWPIQTEMQNRQRSLSSAALSSSIWLVCRKRPAAARPGWDRQVLTEMQANIRQRLRDFWDAGIHGPDFVWAATGPAMEAFSRHPLVKFTDAPGERLTVAEFLRQVRRMVVGFVVSRLFEAGEGAMQELDDPTTYYLLHRNDFGLAPAPAGACILYALSCNLSDADLAGRLDLLARGKGAAPTDDEDADEDTNAQASGSEARLKPWSRRRAKDLGEPAADGSPPPLIDCLHRLMRLWKTGEQSRVDAYLENRGLWRHELFARVVQALIELAEAGSEERAILEYIQNHLAAQSAAPAPRQEAIL